MPWYAERSGFRRSAFEPTDPVAPRALLGGFPASRRQDGR